MLYLLNYHNKVTRDSSKRSSIPLSGNTQLHSFFYTCWDIQFDNIFLSLQSLRISIGSVDENNAVLRALGASEETA